MSTKEELDVEAEYITALVLKVVVVLIWGLIVLGYVFIRSYK